MGILLLWRQAINSELDLVFFEAEEMGLGFFGDVREANESCNGDWESDDAILQLSVSAESNSTGNTYRSRRPISSPEDQRSHPSFGG